VEHYYCHDANFNVTAVVNTSGTVLERYAYTPYGELTVMNASFSPISASTIGNSYTFTGREFDAETGLFHYRNRYYHAQLGRFLSRDPIGYAGSQWNLYEYVSSDPLSGLDPLGLVRWGIHVWLYTGNWSVEDDVWEAATDAAGDSYSNNFVRDGLNHIATVDQIGLFDGTDSALTALEEGKGLGTALEGVFKLAFSKKLKHATTPPFGFSQSRMTEPQRWNASMTAI
jgi:RHS repeat-associated protein